MGHASITRTEIYAHFLPAIEAASEGTAGLSAMLSPAEMSYAPTG